ncbi:hypothetical protein GCM10010231_03260 [Streptomyces sindenensis]|nr:hypothetical protein GCM10010231_03260 [Streptomyces sindenensis]
MPTHCSSDQESYCPALICECIHAGATISAVMVRLLRAASAASAGLLSADAAPPGIRSAHPSRLPEPTLPRGASASWEQCARVGARPTDVRRPPYLLQHADSPVDWSPCSPEAFEEAKRRDVPVLLSIAYPACHRCQ